MLRYTMLHKLRKVMGLTQKQIEMIIGIPQSIYSLIEGGRLIPTHDQRKRLEDFFRMPIADLLQSVDRKSVEKAHDDIHQFISEFRQFISEFRQRKELDRDFNECTIETLTLEGLQRDSGQKFDWSLVRHQLQNARRKNRLRMRRLESETMDRLSKRLMN